MVLPTGILVTSPRELQSQHDDTSGILVVKDDDEVIPVIVGAPTKHPILKAIIEHYVSTIFASGRLLLEET